MRLEIEITALDKASGKIQGIARSFEGLDTKTKKFSSALKRVEKSLVSISTRVAKVGSMLGAALSAATSALGYNMAKVNAQFEKFQLTLETLYGSQVKAKQAMDAVMDFASQTPFELEEITSAFVRLKTYGLEPFRNDTLRILGDVAAAFSGMGKSIDDVVEALADATVGEFERLKEFGIKASVEGQKVILRYIDAHGEVVQKVIEKNEEIVRSTLLAIWNERYGGQMERLSGSWDQMLSNLKDNWTRFMKAVGESGAFQALKDRLRAILVSIDRAFDSGKAQKWAEVVGRVIKIFIDGVAGALKIMAETGKFIYSIGATILELGQNIHALHKASSSFWIDAVKGLVGLFGFGVNKIASLAVQAGGWINEKLVAPIMAVFEYIWQRFKNAAIDAINYVAEKISNFMDWVMEKIPWLAGKIPKGFQPLLQRSEQVESYEDILQRYREDIRKNTKEVVKNLEESAQLVREWTVQNSEFGKLIFGTGDKLKLAIFKALRNVKGIVDETGGEIQKNLQEIRTITQKPAEEFKAVKRTIEQEAQEVQKEAKSLWDRLKDFFKDFWRNFKKSNLGSILDKVWRGIKSVWGKGAKEGEAGFIAEVKSTFSTILQGVSAGGAVGAAGAFLADQLLQNEKIKNALQKIFDTLQKILSPVAEVIAPVIEVIADILMELRPVFRFIAELLKPIASAVRGILRLFTKLDDFFRSIMKPVFSAIKSVLNALWSAIRSLLDFLKSPGEGIKKAVGKIPIVGPVVSAVVDVVDAVSDFVKNPGRTIKKIPIVGSLLRHQGGLVSPVVAHGGIFLGKLKHDEIPVIAQEGEFIVNRQATARYLPLLRAINEEKFTPEVNITINVYAEKVDRTTIEEEIIPVLEDFFRRGKLW